MRVLFAGGGTGGHLFPGIALMEEFRREGVEEFLFVGSKKGMDSRIVRTLNIPYEGLPMEGFKGKGAAGKVRSLLRFGWSILPSIRIVYRFRPHLVIGLGGYTALPVLLVASILGKRTAILEQNLYPGLTNRLLSHFVDHIFASFEDTLRYLPEGKTRFVGNPVRRKLLEGDGSKDERFTILIFGGSQGARGINGLVMEAIDYLEDLRDSIGIIHQTGRGSREEIEARYREMGFRAEVMEFIEDMGMAYRRSHIVICRGGATTIAELTAIGKASIIIPFPHAADNHQEMNAIYLERHGAAWVLRERETEGKDLARLVRELYRNPSIIKDMEERAKGLGRPDAGQEIVRYILSDPETGCATAPLR